MANGSVNRAKEILAIEDVYIRSSEFGVRDQEFDPKFHSYQLTPLHKGSVEKVHLTSANTEEGLKNFVRFEAEMGIRLVSQKGHEEFLETGGYNEKELKVEVVSSFIAQYRLDIDKEIKTEEDVSEYVDDIKKFGEVNALFHIWPYWREYVHQALSRLRIPEIVVPMFIPGQKREGKGVQKSDLKE